MTADAHHDAPRYLLLRRDAREDLWEAASVDGVAFDALRAGLPMDPPPAPAQVAVTPHGAAPSDFIELPCLLVSTAMRRALDAVGVDNVEYFPAHLRWQYGDDDTVLAEYWVANVVGAVACAAPLSAPATHAVPLPAVAARDATVAARVRTRAFRIDPDRARGFDLFRLAEDRRLLVVSQRVAKALRDAGLTGVVLQAPETYTGLPVSTAPPGAGTGAAGALLR